VKLGDLCYGDWKEGKWVDGEDLCEGSIGMIVEIVEPDVYPELISVLWPDNRIEHLYVDDIELL
jgi:hypothetical protein